jgi:hypothetical protein
MGTTLTGAWSESADSLIFFRGKEADEADDGHQSTDDSGAVRTPREEEHRRLRRADFGGAAMQLPLNDAVRFSIQTHLPLFFLGH